MQTLHLYCGDLCILIWRLRLAFEDRVALHTTQARDDEVVDVEVDVVDGDGSQSVVMAGGGGVAVAVGL